MSSDEREKERNENILILSYVWVNNELMASLNN